MHALKSFLRIYVSKNRILESCLRQHSIDPIPQKLWTESYIVQWVFWKTWMCNLFPLEKFVFSRNWRALRCCSPLKALLYWAALSWGLSSHLGHFVEGALLLLPWELNQNWSVPSLDSCLSILAFPRALVIYSPCSGNILDAILQRGICAAGLPNRLNHSFPCRLGAWHVGHLKYGLPIRDPG